MNDHGEAELVTQAIIAKRFGVSTAAVRNWQSRYAEDFPAKAPHVTGAAVWRWDEVVAFRVSRMRRRYKP